MSEAVMRNNPAYLTNQNKDNWPLKIYKPIPASGNQGLACKDGKNSLVIHYATAQALEDLSNKLGKKLSITSAYRSPEYNSRIGGAGNSMHMYGRAFDISLRSIGDVRTFVQTAVKCGFVGFGLYDSFIHIDTGTGRCWNGAASAQFVGWLKSAGWYQGKPGLSDVQVQPETSSGTASANTGGGTGTGTETSSGTASSTETNTARDNVSGRATAYSPQNPSSNIKGMEGGYKSSVAGPDGQAIVRTVDDYANGRSSYVTVAGNPAFYGNAYTIPNLTYRDASGNIKTLSNVPVVVHDTGSAFTNAPEGRFDIPVGRDYNNSQMNSQPFLAQPINFTPTYRNGVTGNGNQMPGGYDPSNSFPGADYQGKPSTHEAAKGHNGNIRMVSAGVDETSRSGSWPAAGDMWTWGVPPSARAPQYPMNTVWAGATGHLVEFDNTPDSERLNFQHKTGTKIEMNPGGSMVTRVSGNAYNVHENDSFTGVMGDMTQTTVGDYNVRSTSDMVLHADGSVMIISHNDRAEAIAGNYKVRVGENLILKAKKIIIEAESIDIYSTGDFNMMAEGEMNIKAKGINIESTDKMSVKTKEDYKIESGKGISIKSENTIKAEAGDAISIKADDIKQEASGDFSIKGNNTKLQGNDLNIKGGMNTKIGATKISLSGTTHSDIFYTNELFSPAPSESTAVPIAPDSAGSADAAVSADVAKEAESADIGNPGPRRNVEKPTVVKPHPDAVKTTGDSIKHYSQEGEA
jgi:hypothetical protein